MRRTMYAAIAISLIRITLGLTHGAVLLSDSGRYYKPHDPTAVFSLDDGKGPGFLLQSIWLAPPTVALTVQLVLTSLAWGFVSVVAAGLARGRKAGIAIFAAVEVWSFLPMIQMWDTAVMTEALATSSTVLAIACLMFLPMSDVAPAIRRHSYPLAVSAALIAMATRPQLAVVFLPLFGIQAFIRRCYPTDLLTSRPRVVWAAGLVGMLILSSALALVASNRIDDWYAQNRLAFRGDSAYLALAERNGMPRCDALGSAIGDPERVRQLDCPDLLQWFGQGGLSPATELVQAPATTLSRFVSDIPEQWTPILKRGGRYLMGFVHDERLGSWPTAIFRWLSLLSLCAALAVPMTELLRRRRASSNPGVALAIMSALAASSGVYLYASWALDGMEVGRHAIPMTLIAAPLCWMAVLISLGDRPLAQPV